MRLTTILLIAGILQVSANTFAQKITLSEKNAPLVKIFEKIRTQSGYDFMFSLSTINNAKPVNINVQDAELKDVLKQIFVNQPLEYKINEKSVVISPKEPSFLEGLADRWAAIDVRGVVRNEKGDVLEGVTVLIKGTTRGTTTDAKGEFFLNNVDEKATLVFSGINIESYEAKINSKKELNINVRTKQVQLEEVNVINTGYQKLSPNQVAGSYEVITKEQLDQRSGVNILSRLEGISTSILFDRRNVASNAKPNSVNASQITIRGISTFGNFVIGVSPPLIVVNNFPYEGDINNINPNDVETITILKDAAASSIYGAKAANGVIVITTKQGKFNEKLQITANSNFVITEKPNLFSLPQMSSSDFIDVETFLFNKGFYNGSINHPQKPGLSPVLEILLKRRDGQISDEVSASNIDALRGGDVRNDFDKYIYRTALSQQYALGLSAGNNNYKYSISGGYDKGLGNLIGDQYTRATFRIDNTISLSKKINLNVNLGYTNSISENNSLGNIGDPNYDYGGFRSQSLYPYAQFVDFNGNHLSLPKRWREGYTDTAGSGKLLDWKFRPLDELEATDRSTKLNDLLFSASLNYKINKSFSIDFRYQFQKSNAQARDLSDESTYNTRELINLFTQLDGASVKYIVPRGAILSNTQTSFNFNAGNIQLNFNHNWKSKNNISAFVTTEIRQSNSSSNSINYYGYNKYNLSVSNVDFVNEYPQYGNRGNRLINNGSAITNLTDRFVSIAGNAAYTFDRKYIFSVSGRRDAANVFGVDINNKWNPIWSAAIAWVVSNENFYKVNALSYLKFRASFGYQGNVNNRISPYAILRYGNASSSYINQPYASVFLPGNPSLSWETIRQLNIAADFGLFKNKITGTVELFRKQTDNLLGGAPIDPTTGLNGVTKNVAGLQGRGLEITINGNVSTKSLKWYSALLFAYTDTKVKKWGYETNKNYIGNYVLSGGASILPIVGRSPYSIYSFPFAGLDPLTGDPQGYFKRNVSKSYLDIIYQQVDSADVNYHGSAVPLYSGAFNHTIAYKGISATFAIGFRLGYFFRKQTINYQELFERGKRHVDFEKRWKKPGDETSTNIPSMVYPAMSSGQRDVFFENSSVNVLMADNIRLEYIIIKYSFDKNLLKRTPFSSLDINARMNNLGMLWVANKEKIDPDYSTGQIFPAQKNITIGISVGL